MQENPFGLDRRSAVVGFVGGVLVLCTIGFFILLGIILSGNTTFAGKNNAANFAAAPTPTGLAGDPSVAGAPVDVQLADVTDADHIRGKKDAPVTLVEYSDTECPFCKRFHESLTEVFADKKYQDNVRWVYRHFPLRSLHSKAAKEAEATECAAKLGGNDAFWKYLDKIFTATNSNDSLDLALLPKFAGEVGVNRSKFEACLNSGETTGLVNEDEQTGNAAGVQGTPHSIIVTKDGKKIPLSGALPAEQVKQALDSVL